MKTYILFTLLILSTLESIAQRKPIAISRLSKKDSVFYKKNKRFTGQTYILNSKDTLIQSPEQHRWDSIHYTFKKGFCTKISFSQNRTKLVSLQRSTIDKQLQTTVQYYWDNGIIKGEHFFINNDLQSKKSWSSGTSGWGKNRKKWFYLRSINLYKNNKLHGSCLTYHSDSTLYKKRNYVNGRLQGKSTTYNRNGYVNTEYYYDNGSKTKVINYYNNSTQIKTIYIYQGYKVIESRTWSYNGKPIFQNIKNKKDSLISTGKYVFKIYDGYESINYKDSVKHGLYEKFYDYNTKHLWERKTYNNGKLEGLRQKWYKNDSLAYSVNYINGKKEGILKQWYNSGKQWTYYNYVNDKIEGTYKRWYKNGALGKTGTYKKGIPSGIHNYYYDDGKQWRVYTYRDTNDGIYCLYESWWSTGQKYEEYELLNGKKHGYYKKWWDSNGNIRLFVEYTNGRKNGKYKNWLENGTIYRDWRYKWNRRIVSKEEREKEKAKEIAKWREEYYKKQQQYYDSPK